MNDFMTAREDRPYPFEQKWNWRGMEGNKGFFGTQRDWNQTLITKINEASVMYRSMPWQTKGLNKIVIHSGLMAKIFYTLEYMHTYSDWPIKYTNGMVGKLSGRFEVVFESDPNRADMIDLYTDDCFMGSIKVVTTQ
jgi:hypothetical protein